MSIVELDARIASNPAPLSEEELEYWIAESDIARSKEFYAPDKETAKQCVGRVSSNFVDIYLNNANPNEVPLRRKTKFCLVLNNFALHKPVRNSVFNAIKNLSGIFEDSMKKEGTMPFDSELGRMSEHVLVLLMRVCQYKLKAAQVHEFAENNTQFAVQLLLAILLKEPPYEFELRCNCISGLLGFTQPQAFFSADQAVEVHSCEGFTTKIDFTLNLMLRLQSVQVVNDVLLPQLLDSNTVPSIVHVALCNMMRCIMNIFQFCSQGATQWRQHVLLSTTLVDGAVAIYIQSQTNALQSLLELTTANSAVPNDMVQGIGLALKFCSFATFHMGRHGRCVRPLCGFIHDLLQLSIRSVVYNPQLSGLMLTVFTNLFHFLCNVDALAGDDGVVEDVSELIPELTSENLKQSIQAFLAKEVASCGAPFLDAWHNKFISVDTDALVSQECVTFQLIDSFYTALKVGSAAAAQPAVPAQNEKRLLGDMPSLAAPAQQEKKKKKKVAVEQAGAVELGQQITVKSSSVASASNASVPKEFLCALSGNTMKNPVYSPYGHTFDRETIELWIKQQGSVCPITGKPLSLDQLQPHKQLQQQIMTAVIQQSMADFNQEEAADLYDF
ncbi:U-box domain protein, putative [Bodo saltans]|uniref:U-box domain protein, putative n=1 Tax=Bodo saltans TaxID=75058 RepID=A0A0S4IVT7_BODSA|nr:U-box domain protein, putative [Bodo saltans]|eukprot:CUF61549.1 U-box domain protein, putative [Bodo saltans]